MLKRIVLSIALSLLAVACYAGDAVIADDQPDELAFEQLDAASGIGTSPDPSNLSAFCPGPLCITDQPLPTSSCPCKPPGAQQPGCCVFGPEDHSKASEWTESDYWPFPWPGPTDGTCMVYTTAICCTVGSRTFCQPISDNPGPTDGSGLQ
jgi:hypothetical protein